MSQHNQLKYFTAKQVIDSYYLLEQIVQLNAEEILHVYLGIERTLLEAISCTLKRESGFFTLSDEYNETIFQCIDRLQELNQLKRSELREAIVSCNTIKHRTEQEEEELYQKYLQEQAKIRNVVIEKGSDIFTYMFYDEKVASKRVNEAMIQELPITYTSALLKTMNDIPEIYIDNQNYFDFSQQQLQVLTKRKILGFSTQTAKKAEYALDKLENLKK